MSNRLVVEPTEFKNIRTGETTLGVRVYDDYGQAYDNTWDEMPDNDLDILKKLLQSRDNVIFGMLDFVQESENGIYIGGNWYDWDDIKDCFEQ